MMSVCQLAAILLIVGLQICAEVLVIRQYALALIFITPLALLMGELARQRPVGPLLRDRVLETVLGVAVATVATLLVRDSPIATTS